MERPEIHVNADPTLLGHIQDVNGATLTIRLGAETLSGLAFVDGHAYRIGQVGSFVRIPLGYTDLYGVVSQAGAGAVATKERQEYPHGERWITVQLVGENASNARFRRGISQFPTVGDSAHLVTEPDLKIIYGSHESAARLRIGSLSASESIPALIDLDRFVTRHSAVVGNTGAGKSTTVSGILGSISNPEVYPAARVIVFDLHGEYSAAIGDRSRVFRVGESSGTFARLFLPYWALTLDELLPITFGSVDETARAAIFDRVLEMKRGSLKAYPRLGVTADSVSVDSPIPFSIHQLWYDLHTLVYATHTAQGNGQSTSTIAWEEDASGVATEKGDALEVRRPRYKPYTQAQGATKIYQSMSTLNLRRQVDALASRLRDPRYSFLFRPGDWSVQVDGKVMADLDALVRSWVGHDRPITILDLSSVPSTISEDVVGILLRTVYDGLYWGRTYSEGGAERPVLVVLEEAHRYLGGTGSGLASEMVRRIVKEGRKHGVGAMIVSQRPSEIDPTILSQCGTVVAMRLTNQSDRGQVNAVVADNLAGFMAALPVLRTGEAIVVGEAVALPMRTQVDPPGQGRRPRSEDPLVADSEGPGGWLNHRSKEDYSPLVSAWRCQDHVSGKGAQPMQREQIVSTTISEAGYDELSTTLEVLFLNGRLYQYLDVPKSVWDDFQASASKGTFLNEIIKKGGYRYARLS